MCVRVCVYERLTTACCSPDDKMLCAGFEESHLMMWSLTPQPLPCRSDSNAVTIHHTTASGNSGDTDETQQRFLHSLHVLCLLMFLLVLLGCQQLLTCSLYLIIFYVN